MADTDADSAKLSKESQVQVADVPQRYQVQWFRGTIFQILVVGGVFFCVRSSS